MVTRIISSARLEPVSHDAAARSWGQAGEGENPERDLREPLCFYMGRTANKNVGKVKPIAVTATAIATATAAAVPAEEQPAAYV